MISWFQSFAFKCNLHRYAKGVAQALAKAGQTKAAIAELVGVVADAEAERDSSVYGMLGDLHTDLADLSTAGAYYDKCLAMD